MKCTLPVVPAVTRLVGIPQFSVPRSVSQAVTVSQVTKGSVVHVFLNLNVEVGLKRKLCLW